MSSHHGQSLGQRSPPPEKGDGLRKEREEEDDDRWGWSPSWWWWLSRFEKDNLKEDNKNYLVIKVSEQNSFSEMTMRKNGGRKKHELFSHEARFSKNDFAGKLKVSYFSSLSGFPAGVNVWSEALPIQVWKDGLGKLTCTKGVFTMCEQYPFWYWGNLLLHQSLDLVHYGIIGLG